MKVPGNFLETQMVWKRFTLIPDHLPFENKVVDGKLVKKDLASLDWGSRAAKIACQLVQQPNNGRQRTKMILRRGQQHSKTDLRNLGKFVIENNILPFLVGTHIDEQFFLSNKFFILND